MSGKESCLTSVKECCRRTVRIKPAVKIKNVFSTINVVFDNYVVGQLTEALILGSLCFIGMIVLRIDYAGRSVSSSP